MKVRTLSPSDLTTIGIGKSCEVLFPENLEELAAILKDENFYIVGGGSNLVISENISNELKLVSLSLFKGIRLEGNVLKVGAGERISSVINFLIKKKLSSIEFLSGIPRATIGGAVAQNAGAFGVSIKDVVREVIYISRESFKLEKLTDFEAFSYRKSPFPEAGVVVEVSLNVRKSENIREDVENFIKLRLEKQPKFWLKTAGSTFKNPEGYSAGYLIEKAGLKGFSTGNLRFSEKHANFLINSGNASFSEFEELINLAKERVQKVFGVDLELEVKTLT